jgi:gluconate 2-dehydrogenase subunit 3-like protein
MATPEETLRALAETVVPGPPHDDTLGAADIEAEGFIAHYLESVIPGLSEGVATILDGMATETREGAGFAALDLQERAGVLQRLCEHEMQDLRELGDLLLALSLASVYGEWSGLDANGELTRAPLGWELTRWPGPADDYPSLLRKRNG